MLLPAQLYKTEIYNAYANILYDIDYQYYFGSQGTEIPIIPDDTYNRRWFVSVDDNNNMIGVITYGINAAANSAFNFGIISFDRGNTILIRDAKRCIDDIFYKYKFNRLDFNCFIDNPAIRGYRAFIKRFGGREVGTLRQSNKLLDGQLHDSVMFEILKDEYKGEKL